MIGTQRRRLVRWCNHNSDFLVVASGALILFYVESMGQNGALVARPDTGFLVLLSGVIMLSVGSAALICYRVFLRPHSFLGPW